MLEMQEGGAGGGGGWSSGNPIPRCRRRRRVPTTPFPGPPSGNKAAPSTPMLPAPPQAPSPSTHPQEGSGGDDKGGALQAWACCLVLGLHRAPHLLAAAHRRPRLLCHLVGLLVGFRV